MLTQSTQIETNWRVREIPRPDASPNTKLPALSAQVPGHIHLDLMRAGVIPDPFYRLFERGAAWVDETDWIYETTFQVDSPAPRNAFLLFHGLDTIAEIELNGEPLGRTDNMFIPHEFAVGDRLRAGEGEAGENHLRVTFRSALRVGRERLESWNAAGNETMTSNWFRWSPRSFVRKAQYMYGWDWGPEPVSCGIWRPVELISVPVARLRDWNAAVAFQGDDAVVNVTAFVERMPDSRESALRFTAEFLEVGSDTETFDDELPEPVTVTVPPGEGRIQVSAAFMVKKARRWNPVHHSKTADRSHPPLYTLSLSLTSDGGEISRQKGARAEAPGLADTRRVKIGLRTIELIRDPDDDGQGEGFKFRVNGEDLFIKGANWIPADSFPSRLENEPHRLTDQDHSADTRIQDLILSACEGGFNMLRVWGGGLYESDHFYELCDQHGILVWQDFAYACAYYPDTKEYAEAARLEAVAAVRRLRTHPSLALWCGNNENQMMFTENWQQLNPPRFFGEHLYDKILPAVVAEEDPHTPYWPGSPYGGEPANSPDYGDRHNWDVWHGIGDWIYYPNDDSRFVSEFGFASSCSLAAWDSCLADEDKYPNSPAVMWHDKTRKGYQTYWNYVTLHYPHSRTLEDLVYYSQLNQADGLKYGVEHYRRRKGRCWGTILWQINDCWPVQSWAIIDSAGEAKAAYYAAKRFNAPVLLSLVRKDQDVEVHVINDLLTPFTGAVRLTLGTFSGEVLQNATLSASVGANAAALVGNFRLDSIAGREQETYLHAVLELCTGAVSENTLFFAEPKDLQLANPGLTYEIEDQDAETMRLILTAQRFAPYVWLHVSAPKSWTERVEWSDNFFHLRPGETREITVYKTDEIDSPAKLHGRLRIRTL